MPDISFFDLFICLLPIVGLIFISQRWSREGAEILWATLRMLGQLLLVGYVLVFIFNAENPAAGFAVVVMMILVSTWIGIRKVSVNRRSVFLKAGLGIGAAGSFVLIYIVWGVLGLSDPWYQPRMIIPLAGMIYSSSMTAITLAAERLEREESGGKTFIEARSAAWGAALIPKVNAFLAVGLVSLPGMMTGQILSGVDPLIAVRYQIVVMAMILQAAGFSVAIFLWLSKERQGLETEN